MVGGVPVKADTTQKVFNMERKEALKRVGFLKGLPDDVIAILAMEGRERSLAKGELLVAENAPCIGLIVVLTGAVKIYSVDSRGRELTLGLEAPGGSVAEVPLFDGGNYPASAEAAKDDTRVLVIARERFLALMETYPQIAVGALRTLSIRLRRQVQMISAQTLHTVRARLAAYLVRVGHGRRGFTFDETNEAIGSHIGSVRDVVSRTLSGLREAGVIAVNGRQVTVLDPEQLKLIATSDEAG